MSGAIWTCPPEEAWAGVSAGAAGPGATGAVAASGLAAPHPNADVVTTMAIADCMDNFMGSPWIGWASVRGGHRGRHGFDGDELPPERGTAARYSAARRYGPNCTPRNGPRK